MTKTNPNLDLLYDKVLDFNEVQPGEYFDSVLNHLSENTSQIHNIFDNLTIVFANNPGLLNALKIVLLFVIRLGAPAFFVLEGSRIPELNLDPISQHDEVLELKRIMRYCLEKFQKMQTAHEIPNIRQKYEELCHITQEEKPIGEISLTDFEQQYSELAVKFQQFEQRLETLALEYRNNKGKIIFENSKGVQLLEQVDSLMIQPGQGFTKSENELLLNFFHQKYALINRIYDEFPQVGKEYLKVKEEKKMKKQQEKGEEDQKPTQDLQIQNLKDFTHFMEGFSLAAFPESMSVEYKDYIYPFRDEELRKKLKATICAFLNTNGGRILIGVGNAGFKVKGLFLTTNDQDTLVRDIDALLKDFHPKVEPEEVTTMFVPVKKRDNPFKPGFYVVKIVVRRGKPNELYFAGRDCYKRRNGQNDVQMPANFKKDIIDRAAITIQTHPELFRDRGGEFNDPIPELGIPVTNVKEKRISETKPVKPVGIKQKQNVQAPVATTKLLVKNLPNKQDIGVELKAVLDEIQPLSKTLLFAKDNEAILAFQKIEDTKSFLDYVEKNPIVIEKNVLQFVPKPLDKEKPEKAKVKVEVEEEKKEFTKARAESTSIIWVRNIPENTNELKEKLTAMLGEHASKLKDIKIHNKKKRSTLEFETSIQANEVFSYLNLADRFIGEAKVNFEKASPPSSPSHTTNVKPSEPAKPKEISKGVEPSNPKVTPKKSADVKTAKGQENSAQAAVAPVVNKQETINQDQNLQIEEINQPANLVNQYMLPPGLPVFKNGVQQEMQPHQQLNPFIIQSDNNYPVDLSFLQHQTTPSNPIQVQPQPFGQTQTNVQNVQNAQQATQQNFIQDLKFLNQTNAYQYSQGPQQSSPQSNYSQFPQHQINPQLGMQANPLQNKDSQTQYQQGINTAQNNYFPSTWQQNQQQQQFSGYPTQQQFNQGQQFGQQNLGNPFQQMNQQGQYAMQTGLSTSQPAQQYPFQGIFANGKVNSMDQTNQVNNQQTAMIQTNKNQIQSQAQIQTPQGHIPVLGAQQNFGGPSYYSGYPQGQLPGNFPFGQPIGYNQNQNMQTLRPDTMYQNVQGSMQGNLQQTGGSQGLMPQQLQQLHQMQQMQYGGVQSQPFVGNNNNNQVSMK